MEDRTMRARSLGRTTIATWLLAVAPGLAHAGDNDRETEVLLQGTEFFLRRDYEAARVALRQAYAQEPTAETLLRLALAELHSGHPVESAGHLREYLTHDEEPGDRLEAVRTKWLPRAEARTARLNVLAPAGAQVLVDGAVQGQGPVASLLVSEGPHDVRAQQATVLETKHILATNGAPMPLQFQLVAEAPPWTVPAVESHDAPSPTHASAAEKTTPMTAKRVTFFALASSAVLATGVGLALGAVAHRESTEAQALQGIARSDAHQAQDRDAALSLAGYVAAGLFVAGS